MADQPFALGNKVALVTGSGRGLGLEIALGLAAAGARVLLNGRARDRLEAARDRFRAIGLDADLAVSADAARCAFACAAAAPWEITASWVAGSDGSCGGSDDV